MIVLFRFAKRRNPQVDVCSLGIVAPAVSGSDRTTSFLGEPHSSWVFRVWMQEFSWVKSQDSHKDSLYIYWIYIYWIYIVGGQWVFIGESSSNHKSDTNRCCVISPESWTSVFFLQWFIGLLKNKDRMQVLYQQIYLCWVWFIIRESGDMLTRFITSYKAITPGCFKGAPSRLNLSAPFWTTINIISINIY